MRNFQGKKLVVATHNEGKLEEVRALFSNKSVEILSSKSLDLPEPLETEDNFIGNARIKAHSASKITGLPALGDDSGITIDALNGAPGVYTADWAKTPNGRDFFLAMKKTQEALTKISAPYPRLAQFRCTLVLAWPDGHDEIFEGTLAGQVVWPPRGLDGHGYDPIFQPSGYEITCGEMSFENKNKISHRSIAFDKLVRACFE